MTFAMAYLAVGLLFFVFSHDLANGLNRLSVRVYENFPMLKKLPFSHLAGSVRNYKSTFYFLRVWGILLAIAGLVFIGMEMLWTR
jgi:hypothetical protein